MKKSRFTESQIVAILKEGEDGMAVAQLARKHVQYVPGDSSLALNLFADRSIDILSIDACHETDAVLRDVDCRIPELAAGPIVAGDDHGWSSVAQAASLRFADARVTPSGCA